MKKLRFSSIGHAPGFVYLWMRREWKSASSYDLPATMTPDEARKVANRLLQSADLAEGKGS